MPERGTEVAEWRRRDDLFFVESSYEYLWADGVKVKDPVKLSAPEYIDCLMSWVEEQLNDQTLFPLEAGKARM